MNILIPMAGLGSRFSEAGYDVPKPLIEFHGKTMIQHAVDTLGVEGQLIFCVHADHCNEHGLDQKLLEFYPDCRIVVTDELTDGPASTCMLARMWFENDDPLIMTNCDQYMMWNGSEFQSFLDETDADGVLVTYYTDVEHNSYAKVNDQGLVTLVREKEVISRYSTNGIHYWKKGRSFCQSYDEMVRQDDRTNGEFYVAPSYNYLIERNFKIRIYDIDPSLHHATGTPDDLNRLLGILKDEA
tara:strand:+ start:13492 stop:14217 length:726 start_codon:yes stop_codon:yes gene_type:complete